MAGDIISFDWAEQEARKRIPRAKRGQGAQRQKQIRELAKRIRAMGKRQQTKGGGAGVGEGRRDKALNKYSKGLSEKRATELQKRREKWRTKSKSAVKRAIQKAIENKLSKVDAQEIRTLLESIVADPEKALGRLFGGDKKKLKPTKRKGSESEKVDMTGVPVDAYKSKIADMIDLSASLRPAFLKGDPAKAREFMAQSQKMIDSLPDGPVVTPAKEIARLIEIGRLAGARRSNTPERAGLNDFDLEQELVAITSQIPWDNLKKVSELMGIGDVKARSKKDLVKSITRSGLNTLQDTWGEERLLRI